MSKFRTVLLAVIGALVMLSIASIANAQRPNPSDRLVAQARSQGPCRDPWITIAIWEKFASTRQPAGRGDEGECKPALYNGGSWSSYNGLYNAVDQTLSRLQEGSVNFEANRQSNGQTIVRLRESGVERDKWLISQDGSSLVSHDGGSIVAQGGGNIILNGGGNRHVQSTATEKRIDLGRSVLIIRKR